jgi:glycosyltransferase involved in cell wall biosynthesis
MTKPLVSIITPTHGRETFLPLIYSCFESQDWPYLEWLIDDDSPEASAFVTRSTDTRIKYYHSPLRRSVGMKRNSLVQRASGEYIVHFDDDDYYGSSYVSHQVRSLIDSNADCVKLSAFFVYDEPYKQLFYWDQTQSLGQHFVCRRDRPRRIVEVNSRNDQQYSNFRLGYGFSYAYRRSVWSQIKFPDITYCEDLYFMTEAVKTCSVSLLPDTSGLCFHVIHSGNVSGCFPQYMIPSFMLHTVFPKAAAYLARR